MGYSAPEIARLLKVSERTPYNWLKQFMGRGIRWLTTELYKGRGRKPKLSKKQKSELYQLILEGPEKNGFRSAVWNSAMINELIFRRYGVIYNPRYLPRLLKKMGLSYQKAGFITDRVNDEKYRQERDQWKKEKWPEILEKAKKDNAVILFGDEVSFAMWGSLSRTWAPKGKQPLVPTKGIRKGLKMYGVIEFASGGFHYMEALHYCLKAASFKQLKASGVPDRIIDALKAFKDELFKTRSDFVEKLKSLFDQETMDRYLSPILTSAEMVGRFHQEGYIEFLKNIMAHFQGRQIILIEDGASYHRSKKVKTFLQTVEEQLTTERLPAFSPDFNPIEKLWKKTKKDATHLKYFETFEKLRQSVVTAFQAYMRDAAEVIRTMAKLRHQAFGEEGMVI
jgi:transposase